MGGSVTAARRSLLTLSLSSPNLFTLSHLSSSAKRFPLLKLPKPTRVLLGFRPLCTTTTTTTTEPDQIKHSMLLERLRSRHLKDSASKPPLTATTPKPLNADQTETEDGFKNKNKKKKVVERFEELGLTEEVMGVVKEMGIEVPTEIQCIGIPAVLEGKSVVLGSHTGSGKTFAYMLPLVQVPTPSSSFFFLISNFCIFFISKNDMYTKDYSMHRV